MAVYRFGVFEFDSATGELRKTARRVRLRLQPARALEHLLRRHGELVSRQELQRVIWPDGTFVHFDHGLNSCMKQIRAALGDSRSAPDYVETLVKRGFRFIAPVAVVPPHELPTPRRRRILVLPVRPLDDGEPAAVAGTEALGEEILLQLTGAVPSEVAVMVSTALFDAGGAFDAGGPVDFFLAAAVRTAGDRLRVTSKLIDARSLCHVWVGRFDAGVAGRSDAPTSVAERIAGGVIATLGRDRPSAIPMVEAPGAGTR